MWSQGKVFRMKMRWTLNGYEYNGHLQDGEEINRIDLLYQDGNKKYPMDWELNLKEIRSVNLQGAKLVQG